MPPPPIPPGLGLASKMLGELQRAGEAAGKSLVAMSVGSPAWISRDGAGA